MTNPSSGPTQNASTSSFYDVLGLRPNASVQDIRRAYRDLSKLYHPDTTELESAIATSKFQTLNEAYATLSSPEKRLTYDYQNGFSRLSVMPSFGTAPGQPQNAKSGQGKEKYSSNAYIDPNDRPLSAGEFFALFILGITFICCLILVVTLSLTRSDTVLSDVESPESSQPTAVQISPQPVAPRPNPWSNPSSNSSPNPNPVVEPRPDLPKADLPQSPWLIPKSRTVSPSLPSGSADTLLERMSPSLKPQPQSD